MSASYDDSLKGQEPRPYKPPQGPRHDGETAIEVTRLSVEMGYVRRDLDKAVTLLEGMAQPETGLYARLTRIETKLQQIPSNWGVVKIVGTLLAVFAALTAFVAPPVQKLIAGDKATVAAQPAVKP